jgi:hypothetical protein
VSTGELEERRPIDDRERARQFGAEFGPAALERVTRSVSGLANGIFLPVPLAYAAGRQGVMVTGYRKDGGGIPSD